MNDEMPSAKKLATLLIQQYTENPVAAAATAGSATGTAAAGAAIPNLGKWDAEDLAIVYLSGPAAGVAATVNALTAAEVDGNKLIHHSAAIPTPAPGSSEDAGPSEAVGSAAGRGLGLALLQTMMSSQMGASVDLSPLTGQYEFLDDWGALTDRLAQVQLEQLDPTGAGAGIGAAVAADPEAAASGIDTEANALSQVLLAAHTNALRAVAAAAEAEGVTWSRIGTTGGEILVITGDGIAPHPEHTLLVFDPAELRTK